MDIEYIKVCGLQSPLVFHLRDLTYNRAIHRMLAAVCVPFGMLKALINNREKYIKTIAVVAIAKNEARYLREWVEFYLEQGFDNIILFDNDSTDNVADVLQPFIISGFVIYQKIHGKIRQLDAYYMAVAKYKYTYKYLAFIDCDEFLFCKDSSVFEYVDHILSEKENGGGIGVNWLVFGSSGLEKKPDGNVVDSYLFRAEDDFEANHHIKTVCNPRKILGFTNPHNPYYRRGYYNLDEDGEIIHGPKTKTVKYNHIRINHYFTKSREEYLEKMYRGKADSRNLREITDFINHDKNDVFDNEIIKWKNSRVKN